MRGENIVQFSIVYPWSNIDLLLCCATLPTETVNSTVPAPAHHPKPPPKHPKKKKKENDGGGWFHWGSNSKGGDSSASPVDSSHPNNSFSAACATSASPNWE